MKRIGIFSFYDYEGVVDEYIEILLLNIQEVVSDIVIIVNGVLQDESLQKMKKYSNKIFFRDNYGYDGGAYKDIILHYLGNSILKKYDEMILFNNTFYGPFFSLKDMFCLFDAMQVDFWGLSNWRGTQSQNDTKNIPSHIQAYFLVIKSRMLHNDSFYNFWEMMEYPNNYEDAIIKFEAIFTNFFVNKGFTCKSWIELNGGNKYIEPGKVIYYTHAYELLKFAKFPIIKRKSVCPFKFFDIVQALKYIEDQYNFNNKVIWNHIYRLEQIERFKPYSFIEIDNFCMDHSGIYLFGCGRCAKSIAAYLTYRNKRIINYITSNGNNGSLSLEEVNLTNKDGIIVALNEDNFLQVKEMLIKQFDVKQLLLPQFD